MNRMIRPGAEWSLRINTAIGRKHVSTHSRSCARIVQLALSVGLYASLAAPTHAQVAAAPFELPFTVILTDATPLQQTMFNAVARMCVGALDFNPNLNAQQQDLHDQCTPSPIGCHESRERTVGRRDCKRGCSASALGALQQVSGNQITSQGSLAPESAPGSSPISAGVSTRCDSVPARRSLRAASPAISVRRLSTSMARCSIAARKLEPHRGRATAFIPAASGSFISTATWTTVDACRQRSEFGILRRWLYPVCRSAIHGPVHAGQLQLRPT